MKNLSKILTPKFLTTEYVKNRKSSTTIAVRAGCGKTTILRYLKKFKISVRAQGETMRGKKYPNMSKARLGEKHPYFGKKRPEHSKKMIGKNNPFFGKSGKNHPCFKGDKTLTKQKHYCIDCLKMGIETKICYANWRKGSRRCSACSCKGKNNPNYIDGRTPVCKLIKNLEEHKIWRKRVFERDNYTCQDCFKRGGNKEAHHKKAFAILLEEFLQHYNQFSPIEDKETLVRLAITWKDFWDVDNGQTLCKKCHIKYTNKFLQQIDSKNNRLIAIIPEK